MIVLMSDLCLGTADEREDFLDWGPGLNGPEAQLRITAAARLDRLFLEFLRWKLAAAATKGVIPTLVLLGNTFDFWQSRCPRETPEKCITRILEVHLEFTVAIREWMGAGGEVTLVLGARDHALVDPSAWERLREIFPQLNLRFQGRWTHWFADEETGLYAEHGGRWNPFSRLKCSSDWDSKCSAMQLIQELGRRLEPRFPWLDKLNTFGELLQWLNVMLNDHERRHYGEMIQRFLRKRAFISRLVLPWLEGKPANWRALTDREISNFYAGLKHVNSAHKRLDPAPQNLRFVAHGHLREQSVKPFVKGPTVICPGTWCPTITGGPEFPQVQQPLPYLELAKNPEGLWVPEARQWRAESREVLNKNSKISV